MRELRMEMYGRLLMVILKWCVCVLICVEFCMHEGEWINGVF